MAGRDAVEGIRRFEIDRRSTAFGLITSAIFHLLLIGSYTLSDHSTVKIRYGPYKDSIIVGWLGLPEYVPEESPPVNTSILSAGIGYLPRPIVGIHTPVSDSQAIIQEMLDELARRWEDFPTFSGLVREDEAGSDGAGEGFVNGTIDGGDGSIGGEAEPPEFIPGIERFPQPIKKVIPEYPEIARIAGLEGKVYLKMLITKAGIVKKAAVVKSDHEVFEMMALQAALGWVFTPGMTNAGPVAVWVTVPFEFKLNK